MREAAPPLADAFLLCGNGPGADGKNEGLALSLGVIEKVCWPKHACGVVSPFEGGEKQLLEKGVRRPKHACGVVPPIEAGEKQSLEKGLLLVGPTFGRICDGAHLLNSACN